MKLPYEVAAETSPFTLGEMQVLMKTAWEMGYREGYVDSSKERDFDLTRNPWSEENNDY